MVDSEEYDATVDRALAGEYSYGYAADLLMTFYRSMNAWHDTLREEPLPALRGDWSCTLARDWIALSGKALGQLAGWWGLSFRAFPYGDYAAELEQAVDRYFEGRDEARDAIERCEQGS